MKKVQADIEVLAWLFYGGAMKLANRLLRCAELVRQGNVAADIGTDHGYLPIYLLTRGICPRVIAADIHPMPLEAAKRNAVRAGIKAGISFYLSDGLRDIPVAEIQTVICAGMGGDCIIGILEAAKASWKMGYQLILQPQSAASVLRKWLSENQFSIQQERLAQDGRHIYTIIEAKFEAGAPEIPGHHFLSRQLMVSGDPLLPAYYDRIRGNLVRTVEGLRSARRAVSSERLLYFEEALGQIVDLGEQYGLCK